MNDRCCSLTDNERLRLSNLSYALKDKVVLSQISPEQIIRTWEEVWEIIFPSFVETGGLEDHPKQFYIQPKQGESK